MDNSCYLICGLGNPGSEYKNTRHNFGFLIIENICRKMNVVLKKNDGDYLIASARHADKKIFLAQPQSYMNKSGIPVQKIMGYYKINPENLLIAHDDLDIELGKMKLALNGGAGGHNGIRSIISQIGTKNFFRLKAGISKPIDKFPVEKWVLSQFTKEESDIVDELTDLSTKGILLFLEKGVQFAMNFINSVDLRRKNAD